MLFIIVVIVTIIFCHFIIHNTSKNNWDVQTQAILTDNAELMKKLKLISYGDNYIRLTKTNLRIRSYFKHWMSFLNPDISLIHVAICGTHNSLTYNHCGGPILRSWLQFQDSNIKTQLRDGIRFFEFNFTYDNSKIMTYVYNTICHINYTNICDEIIKFLTENPYEILIIKLSIQYTDDVLKISNDFIKRLQSKIIKPYYTGEDGVVQNITPLASLKKLREHGNIIIISDIDSEYFYPSDYLSDPQTIVESMVTPRHFKELTFRNYTLHIPSINALHVLQAYSTIGFWDIFNNYYTNIQAAIILNKELIKSIDEDKIKPPINVKQNFNIIAVDFYQIENINEYVINLNYKYKNFI